MTIHDDNPAPAPAVAAPAETQKAGNVEQFTRGDKFLFLLFNGALMTIGLCKLAKGGANFYDSIWGWTGTGGISGWRVMNCTKETCPYGESYSHWQLMYLRLYSEGAHDFLLGAVLISNLLRNFREGTTNTLGKSLGESWISIAWPCALTLLPLFVAFGLSATHVYTYLGLVRFRSYVTEVSSICLGLLMRDLFPRLARISLAFTEIDRRNNEIWTNSGEIIKTNKAVIKQYEDASGLNQEILERIANRGRDPAQHLQPQPQIDH